MKRLLYSLIGISTLLSSCGDNKSDKNNDDFPLAPLVSQGDMSIGDAEGINSRQYWEWMRLHDPATGEIPANIRERELAFAKTLPINAERDFTWEQKGPINIGGRTRALAIDVLDENIWISGGTTGGIWRSEDAGTTWTKVTAQDQMHSVTSIVQDTRAGHESTWYAGTGEYYAVVSHATWESRFSGDGIMKSTDNGLTWDFLPSTQSGTPETSYDPDGDMDYVWRLVIDPTDASNDVVLAAVFNGVYRSEDGGATWTEALGFDYSPGFGPGCDYVDLVVTPSGVFYATFSSDDVGRGVYRSDDGITWAEITPGIYPSAYGKMVMAVNPLDENIIWLFGDTNGPYGDGHSVFRYEYVSGDGSGAGGLWEDRSINLPIGDCLIPEIGFNPGTLNTQSSFDVCIAIHPTDTNVIYIAGTSIWRNKDGFTADSTNTWIGGYQCPPVPYDDPTFSTSYPNHHPDQHLMTFHPSDPSILINTNDGGVYSTVDCLADSVAWNTHNNGYITTQFYGVGIMPGETYDQKIIGGMQDNNTYVNMYGEYDSAWVKVTGGDGMFCAITEGGEYYLACRQYGRLMAYQLNPDGSPIAYERIDPEGGPSAYNWANSYKVDPNNPTRIYWNGRNRIWRLDDLNDITLSNNKTDKEPDHWDNLIESITSGPEGQITDIEMSKSWPNTVWYGTAQGHLFRLNYADDNDACIRVDLTDDKFPAGSWLASIGVNPQNHNEIIISFANYNVPSIFYTTDGGQSWEDISGNLEENTDGTGAGPSVLWVEWYPNGTLFAGTSTGLYTTDFPNDSSTVWTNEPGIGNVIINHMDFRSFDGRFVVGTHGRGVFETYLPSHNVGIEEPEEEFNFEVYPTVTSDQIVINGVDELTHYYIFDLNGKMVFSSPKTSNQMEVNVSRFKAGTYVLVGSGSDTRASRKFVRR